MDVTVYQKLARPRNQRGKPVSAAGSLI